MFAEKFKSASCHHISHFTFKNQFLCRLITYFIIKNPSLLIHSAINIKIMKKCDIKSYTDTCYSSHKKPVILINICYIIIRKSNMSGFFFFMNHTEISYKRVYSLIWKGNPSYLTRHKLNSNLQKKKNLCGQNYRLQSSPPFRKFWHWFIIHPENLKSSEKHILMSVLFDLLSQNKSMLLASKIWLYQVTRHIVTHNTLCVCIKIEGLYNFNSGKLSYLTLGKCIKYFWTIYGKEFWRHVVLTVILLI